MIRGITMFYVYAWYNKKTKEIFYIGKGCNNRYKQVKNRNKLFIDYYNNNDCGVKIIKWFNNEDEALEYENKCIIRLKKKGRCSCNLDNGGTGGLNIVWTEEMRQYQSEYNPMKREEQKERMSKHNPMKNKDVAKRNGKKHMRAVIINGNEYESLVCASKECNVTTNCIMMWCKRGYDTYGKPCRYKDENQKEYVYKKTSSKAVIIDGEVFQSLREAANFLGVKYTEPLLRAIKANRKYKGHTCKYGNQQPSHTKPESSVKGSTTNK